MRPHRRQPTRLPRPWDSPGKNTGVGCYFLLQCVKVKSEREVAQSCPTLSDPMDCSPPGSAVHGIFQARELEWVPLPSPTLYTTSVQNLTLGSWIIIHSWKCLYSIRHLLIFKTVCWWTAFQTKFWIVFLFYPPVVLIEMGLSENTSIFIMR